MSVGVVYVQKKYSSLFTAFEYNCEERREAIEFTGYVI